MECYRIRLQCYTNSTRWAFWYRQQHITFYKIITIGAEENGNYISGGTLKSEKGFTFASGSGTYAAVSLYYDSYDAAKQKADTISNALPAYTGGGKWQIYVSGTTGDQLRQKTGLACENVSSTANMILIHINE